MVANQIRTTHIALVIDNSASMAGVASAGLRAINSIMAELRDLASPTMEIRVTLMFFDEEVPRPKFYNADASMLKPLTEYRPDGRHTALWDAVDRATYWLDRGAIPEDDNAFLVMVVTDGQDNYSNTPAVNLRAKIQTLNNSDRWTFVFQAPPGYGRYIRDRLSLPEGNVREWSPTDRGVQEVEETSRAGLRHYVAARAAGRRNLNDGFYRTTDLSGLSKRDVMRNLEDLSDRFKVIKVSDDEDGAAIRPFVELKAKMLSYVSGCAFYQLTKTEEVQPQKAVLLMPKGEKKIYGGQQARDLIGIGHGSTVKVTPGDHSGFDVFIQSTSINRKLVGGTRVLVDTGLKKGLPPTWDHAAAGIR